MQRVQIGKILKPVGLKGELKVQTDWHRGLDVLFVGDKEYKVLKNREYNNFGFYYLDGIDTIEKADKLRGQNVYADRDKLSLGFDEILTSDLKGFKAIGDGKPKGRDLGTVTHIHEYGGNVTLETTLDATIPYDDPFIIETNFTTKTIVVRESLLEEEEV